MTLAVYGVPSFAGWLGTSVYVHNMDMMRTEKYEWANALVLI